MSNEKKIEDYLHLYIGHSVMIFGCDPPELEPLRLIGVDVESLRLIVHCDKEGEDINYILHNDSVKPMLRSLSDMTVEEEKEVKAVMGGSGWYYAPESMTFLLSKGFDLFGLIESGLAINKKDVLTTPTRG